MELTYRYDENKVLEVRVDAFGKQSIVKISRNLGLNEAEMEKATADLMRVCVE